jgi:hypothetical protein
VLKDEQTSQDFRAASIHLLAQLMDLSEFHGGVDLQGNPNTTADRTPPVPSLPPRRQAPRLMRGWHETRAEGELLTRLAHGFPNGRDDCYDDDSVMRCSSVSPFISSSVCRPLPPPRE